ncbi:MAG: DUF1249 domain-containing protein [Gammaproteobacteria bacterium]
MLMKDHTRAFLQPRPQSFADLMELYETNYIYFRRLCPDLGAVGGRAVSRTDGALDLHMDILERCRYTTTVRLTHHLCGHDGGERSSPDVQLRVYNDARQAEILTGNGCEQGDDGSCLLQRWRLNRFLAKWLGYCLHQGHRLNGIEAPVEVTGEFI